MTEFLVFRLFGPMASWGDVAVGGFRPSQTHPSKSAVIGLLEAALGIRREQEDVHKALATSCSIAIEVERAGTGARDYHTIQVPAKERGVEYYTRKDELSTTKLNTILSARDYMFEAQYLVCLWLYPDGGAGVEISEMRDALLKPKFNLYLGRKCCPPALPVWPIVIEKSTFEEALEAYAARTADTLKAVCPSALVEQPSDYYWESSADTDLEPVETFVRRDVPLNRKRWQFGERAEHHARPQRG